MLRLLLWSRIAYLRRAKNVQSISKRWSIDWGYLAVGLHIIMPYLFDKATVTAVIGIVLLVPSNFVVSQSPSYPTLRFVPWDQTEALEAAEILGYNSTSWDNPGSNPIEKLTYEIVVQDSSSSNALEELRIDELSWDCYINHFRGYTWPNLANEYKSAYQTLGWDHVSWNQISDPPESENFAWDALDAEERNAASTLCYFEELWDSIPINEWDIGNFNDTTSMFPSTYPSSTTVPSSTPILGTSMSPSDTPSSMIDNTETPSLTTATSPPSRPYLQTSKPSLQPTRLVLSASVLPTILPTTQLTIPIPYFRYIPWSKLDDDTRILAILLGYTQISWDFLGSAAIEHMSFDMIVASNMSRRIAYIEALGFSKPSWDCYITHYRPLSWEQLSEHDVQQYYETLGWTKQLWNSSESPRSDLLTWNDLNIEERVAAESLCYFEPIWNNVSLEDNVEWRVNPSLPSSFSRSAFSWAIFVATTMASTAITLWNALPW